MPEIKSETRQRVWICIANIPNGILIAVREYETFLGVIHKIFGQIVFSTPREFNDSVFPFDEHTIPANANILSFYDYINFDINNDIIFL